MTIEMPFLPLGLQDQRKILHMVPQVTFILLRLALQYFKS